MLKKLGHKIMLVFVTGLLAFSTIAIAKAAIKEDEEKTEPILEEQQLEIPPTDTTDFILAMSEEVWKHIDEQKQEDQREVLETEKIEKERVAAEQAKKKAEQIEKERLAQVAKKQAKAEQLAKEEKVASAATVNTQPRKKQSRTVQAPSLMSFKATHYTAYCNGCSGITKTGINARQSIYHQGYRIIAVDPSVIPLGSIVEVSTPYGSFTAIAGDTGGAIKGNKIDILVGSTEEAYRLGVVNVEIRIVSSGSQ